ncbi:uncharacterized protein nuggc.L isoform X1 [Xenopus laevis]|uniref:Uncharacterized protein nuggc.L isoform X1 n=1 Tax=Xenopus laevis TaxID=8355 RepID=A0A8J0VKQ5_XENLA|nr:uncharacterized protein nuggc.L isoform X1 [Xenopus laevis]XP_018123874.1 uncharacterized protein nuggc.L isoform X1 [Xenopus laevis]XP_018123875.1 uncharacterized protein nuggc.L isoform X1 [Xenopus laevis]
MSEQTMHNVYRAPGFHLRRIGRRGSQPDALNYIHFLKPVTLIGRNRNVVDHFATAQDSYGRRYISRVHARVICTSIPMSFKLLDSSLTGVYVNDVRIEAEHFLHEGDTVTFGHPEGANICPGTRARQPNSELYFLFEHCHCTMEQLSSDGSPEMQEFAVSPSLNLTEANMHAQVDNGMTTESNISRSPTCTSHPRNVFEEQKEEAEPSISMGAPNYHSSPPEYTSIESIMDRSMIEPSSKETSNISLHSSKSWDSDEEGSYQSEEGNTLKRKCSAQVPEFSVTDPYCEIGANDSSCDGIESEYGDVTSPCHLLQHREDEFCEKQDDERIENQSVVKCDASPRVWPESDKSLSVYATSEHTADTSDSPVAHMLLQLDTNKENQATGCISASVCLVSSEKPLQAQVISFEKSKESCCTEKSLHKYKDSPPLPTCNLSSMIKEDVELNKRHKNAEIANSGSVSPAVIPLRTVMSSEPCTVVKEPQDKTTGEHIEFVSIDDSVSREAEDLNLCSAVGKSIDKKQMQMDPCEQAVMHMESNGSENKLSIGQAECGENRVPNESLGVCHSRNVKEAVPPRENDSAMVMRETRCGSGSPPSLQLVQCREEGPLQATANVLLQKDTNEKAERDVKVEQINLNGVYNSATNNNDELYTLNDPQTGILLSEQKQQHKKPSDGHTEEHSFDFQIVNVCSLSPSIKLQTLDQNNGSTKSIGSENVCVGSTEDKFIGGQDLVEARNCGKMVDTDKQVCVLSQDSNTMRVQNSETVTCPHDIAADPLHTIGSGGYNLVPASVQDSSFPEPIASSDLHNDMEGDNRNSLGLKRCFHDTGSRLSSEKEVPPKKCRTWHEESHETSAIGAHGANIGNILQQFITAHQTVRQADSREVTACAQNQHLIAQITCNFFKSLETVCLSQAQPFSLTHTEIPVEAQSVSETLMSHYIADATQSAPYITEQTQSVFVAHSASHITEETQSISLTHTASDILKQTQFVRVAHTVPHITDETQSVSVAHTVPYITEEAQCVSVAHSDNFIIEEKQSVTVAHTVSHITEEAQCVSVAHMTSDTDEAQSVSMVHLTPDIPEETQYIADEAQSISVTHVAANTDETLSVSVTDIAHHIAEEISVSVAHLDPLITDEIQSVSVTHMAPDTDEIQSVSVTDITPDIAEEINPFITGETQSVCVAHSIPNITEKAQSAHVAHLASEIPEEIQPVSDPFIADEAQSISVTDLAPDIAEEEKFVSVAHSDLFITEETQSVSAAHLDPLITDATQSFSVTPIVPNAEEVESVSVTDIAPDIAEEINPFITDGTQSVCVAHSIPNITKEAQSVRVAHLDPLITEEAQSVCVAHLDPLITEEAQSVCVAHLASDIPEETQGVSVAHSDAFITDERQSVSVTHIAPDTDKTQSVCVTDITPDIAEEINPFITDETQSVHVAHSVHHIAEEAQSVRVAHLDHLITDEAQYASVEHLVSEIPKETQSDSVAHSDPFIADEAQFISVTHVAPNREETQSVSVTGIAPNIAEEVKSVSVANLDPLITEETQSVSVTDMAPDIQTVNVAHSDVPHSHPYITEETQSVSVAHVDPLIKNGIQSVSVTPIDLNTEKAQDLAPDIAEEINPFITDGTQSVCVAHSIPYITEEAQSALVADLDPLITDATQSISVAHLASDIPEETQHVSVAHSDAFITDERQSVSVTHMAPNTDTTQSVSVTDITPDIAEEINPFIKDETQSVRVTHSVPRITEEAHSVLVAHLDPLITDEAQYASVSLLDPLITDEAQYDSVALLDPLITDEAQYASVAHLASEIPEETQSVSVAHSDPFIADEAQSISVTHMAPNRDETQSVSVTGIAPNIAEEVKSVSVAHLDPLITDEIQSVTPMALNSEEAQSVSLTEMVPDITEEIQTVNVAHSDPYITEQTQSVSVTHTIVESMKHVRVIHTAPNIEEEKSSAGVAHSSYDSSEDTQSFSVTDTDPNISGTVIYTAPDTTEQAQSVSLTHFAPDIAENTQSVSVKHMAPDIAKNTQSVSVTHSAPDISENTQSVSVTHSAPDISENTQSDSVTHTTADNGNTVRAWYSHIREEHKQKISYNLQLSSGNCASVHLSPDITRTMESGANTNHTAELGIQGINASNSSTCTLGVASEVPSVSHASNSDQPTLVIVAETDASATGSLGSKKQSFSDCDNTFSSKGTGPRSSSPENINTSEWRCVSPDYSPQGHGRTAHSHQEAFSKELGLLLPAVKASTEPVPRMMAIKSKTTHNSQCISECRPCNVTPTGNNVMMGDLSSPSTFAYHTSQTQPVIKEEGDEYNVASSAKVSSPTDQRFLGQVQGAMYIASSSESLQTISPCRTQHTDTEVIVISDSDEEKPFVNSELRAMFEKDLPKMSLKRKRKTQRPDISEYDRTEMVCGKSENLAPYFDSRAIIVIDSDDNNEVDVKEEEDVDTDYGVQVSSEQYRLKESKEHSWPQPDSWESPNVSAESGVAISPFSGAHSPVFPSLYNAQPASSSFVNMTPPVPPKSISNISLEENLPLPSPFSDDFDILPSDSDLEKIYSDEENASKDSGLSQVMAPPLQFLKYPETQKKTITSSSGESSSETLNVNFKRSEEQQCAWARSEHDVRFQLSECQSVLREVSQVLSDIQGIDEHTMEQWRKGILDLQKESPLPQTHIAVVGDTGAGKSSLLNALLEQEDVLPTSAMRACTAVVVEIEKSSVIGYKADVEFFSKEEWERELKALITDMKDKSGHFKRRPDNKPETRVAHSRVMAVYGKIAELHELKNDTTVTKYLGEKKQISENTASAFRSAIEKYIDTNSEQPRQKKGGQFWPIVKCVRIFVPEAEVLRTGAVLVDLPGTRDSNAARDRIAKEYLQKCDVVWVVTNITRAVDDKTAKEILTSNMRRQLFMDGHYESMAVICTKTDLYNTQEIKRALNLHDETSNLEDTVVRLGHRLNTLEAEKKTLYEQWDKGETFAAENDPRNEILAKEKEISFLKQQKEESLRNINLICVRARNNYSKQRICHDFYQSRQELIKGEDEADGEVEDEEESDAESNMDEELSEDHRLRVFTVSSKEYLDLRRRSVLEGSARLFNSERDTEIPDLRDYAIETALRCSMLAAERVIRNTACIISQVITYLLNRKAQDESDQEKIKLVVEKCLDDLQGQLREAVSVCNRQMTFFIQEKIRQSLAVGVSCAEKSCENIVKRWGFRQSGGYTYPTYKATCVRQGFYSSPACGVIDFNEQLSQPITSAITKSWSEVFSGELVESLSQFNQSVPKLLVRFFKNMRSELFSLGTSYEMIAFIEKQQLKSTQAELLNFFVDQKEYISRRQRHISRLLTPEVQKRMIEVYNECQSVRGEGSFEKMKHLMFSHVKEKKHQIFREAADSLMEQLNFLQTYIRDSLNNFVKERLHSLRQQCEPLLQPMKKEEGILPDLRNLWSHVSQICQRSQVDFHLPELEITPKPEPCDQESRAPNRVEPPEITCLCKVVKVGENHILNCNTIKISAKGVELVWTESPLFVPFSSVRHFEFCSVLYFLTLHLSPDFAWMFQKSTFQTADTDNKLLLLLETPSNTQALNKMMDFLSWRQQGTGWYREVDLHEGRRTLEKMRVYYTEKQEPKQEVDMDHLFLNPAPSSSTMPPSFLGVSQLSVSRKRGSLSPHQGVVEKKPHVLTNPTQQEPRTFPSWPGLHHRTLYPPFPRSPKPNPES